MRTRAFTADPPAVRSRGLADGRLLALARAAAVVGAATAVAFGAVALLTTPTPDEHPFQHAADYWYTGLGMLPMMAAPLVLVVALHRLQHGRGARLGAIGTVLAAVSFVVFVGMGAAAMVMGRASSFGPTYLIAMFVNLVGVTLAGIGSWRSGLLPGWLASLWIVAWVIGGPIPLLPPLLAAPYLVMAARLPVRVSPPQPAARLGELDSTR